MIYSFFRFILIAIVVFGATTISVSAQREGVEREEIPKGIKETLIKNRIEREKKDFQELLERGAEAAKLSEEVDKSFVENKQLTVDDQKKLERLEKISKKIRSELGGDSDSENADETKIYTTSDAIGKLKSVSAKLSEELKKTTRYTISAIAVQSSNTVLKIVRFIRTGKN